MRQVHKERRETLVRREMAARQATLELGAAADRQVKRVLLASRERMAPLVVKVPPARPEGPAYKESPVRKEKPEARERRVPREQTVLLDV